MKIFYNENGVVVGTVEGALPDIEDKIDMPNTISMQAPEDIAIRLSDPKDPLNHTTLKIVDGVPVEIPEEELAAQQAEQEQQQIDAEQALTELKNAQPDVVAVTTDLQTQIDELKTQINTESQTISS